MFYKREIQELKDEIINLRAELRSLKLYILSDKGTYHFNVGEEVKILRGTFKIQNRGYYYRGKADGFVPYMRYFDEFFPEYLLVGIDNQDVIHFEEKELIKELAEYKCIEQNINRS